MSIKVGDLVRIKHNRAEIMELRLTEERCSNIVSPNSPVGQALLTLFLLILPLDKLF